MKNRDGSRRIFSSHRLVETMQFLNLIPSTRSIRKEKMKKTERKTSILLKYQHQSKSDAMIKDAFRFF